MYLQQNQLEGLGLNIFKKVLKKVVQPLKHVQTKAPEVKKLTGAAATLAPGPWTAGAALIASRIPEKKKVSASAADIAPPETTAAVKGGAVKVILPLATAVALAFLALR